MTNLSPPCGRARCAGSAAPHSRPYLDVQEALAQGRGNPWPLSARPAQEVVGHRRQLGPACRGSEGSNPSPSSGESRKPSVPQRWSPRRSLSAATAAAARHWKDQASYAKFVRALRWRKPDSNPQSRWQKEGRAQACNSSIEVTRRLLRA
jgi:hypothetical protein